MPENSSKAWRHREHDITLPQKAERDAPEDLSTATREIRESLQRILSRDYRSARKHPFSTSDFIMGEGRALEVDCRRIETHYPASLLGKKPFVTLSSPLCSPSFSLL